MAVWKLNLATETNIGASVLKGWFMDMVLIREKMIAKFIPGSLRWITNISDRQEITMAMESSHPKVEKDIMANSKMVNIMDMVSYGTVQCYNSLESLSWIRDKKMDSTLIS